MLLRLGIGAWLIKKESCDFFESHLADVYSAMDPGSWFLPVHLAGRERFTMGFAAVLEFDIEKISAENDGDAMVGIGMPRRGFSREQAQSPD